MFDATLATVTLGQLFLFLVAYEFFKLGMSVLIAGLP